jgi:hypothetical protein
MNEPGSGVGELAWTLWTCVAALFLILGIAELVSSRHTVSLWLVIGLVGVGCSIVILGLGWLRATARKPDGAIPYAWATVPPKPGLRQALHSLGCTQLLKQSQRALTYDTQALGTMGFDVAFAALVVSTKAHAYIWLVSLALLVVSVFVAAIALFTSGAEEDGPEIKAVLDKQFERTDDQLETQVIEDIGADIIANEGNLAAKTRSAQLALGLLMAALLLELLGQL